MATIHQNDYLAVQHYVASAHVRVVRSERPFESSSEVLRIFAACRAALAKLDCGANGLLYDWRRSPISNDPKLHRALVNQMDSLASSFRYKAILVATAIGTIQANRVGRAMSDDALRVFDDEPAALDHVTGK